MVNVIYHVIGLAFIKDRVVRRFTALKSRRNFIVGFALVMGVATLLVTLLHALEAGIWAGVYFILGALPDGKSALLYSLSAMTTYGHENFFLGPIIGASWAPWRL